MAGRADLAGKTIGIAGLGQIGGSMAAALTARTEAIVLGCDTNSELTQAAAERKIVAETVDCDSLVDRASIVVLATPFETTLELLRKYAESFRARELVIDTCSLKQAVGDLATELQIERFVGGHPLAGTAKRGSEAWDAELFVDAFFLMCPTVATPDHARELGVRMTKAIGSKSRVIDSETHDRLFALTSGLPHAVAVALGRMFESEAAGQKMALAGPSFRSATRVASSEPALIKHLLYDNRMNVAERLDKLIAILTQFRDSLRDNDRERFDSLLKD